MRLLLDECLPARLRLFGEGHQIRTVQQLRWPGVKNGALLKLIAESGDFDVFVTMDKNLPKQQKVAELPFAVAVLRARSNRFADTKPLMEELLDRLSETRPGEVLVIGNG
jgi:hypothetical protein